MDDFWWSAQQRRTADALARGAWPEEDVVHDVVVVGAGITGAVTALSLAERGRDVLLLDATGPAAVTSGLTTGKVSLLQGRMLSRVLGRRGPAEAHAYVQSTRAAMDWVEGRFGEGGEVSLERRTAFTFGGPGGHDVVREERDACRALDVPVFWDDDHELGLGDLPAIGLHDQLQLDPVALVLAVVSAAVDAGTRLHVGTRVTRVRDRGDHAEVAAADGQRLRARDVVLATGAPIVDRRLHFARLVPQRSYLMAFEHDAPAAPMALRATTPSRSFRSAHHRGRPVLLVGGAGHVTGRGPTERSRVDSLRRWARETFDMGPELAAWSAQDYATPDSLPLVGPLGGPSRHVHVATGFNKWGLTSGVAAGLALAGDLVGEPRPWAGPLYARRALLSDVATVVRHQVGVAVGGAEAVARLAVSADGPTARRALECGVAPVCTHLGGVLRWNSHEQSFDCPLHGSRFGADGEVLEGPATRPLLRRGGAGRTSPSEG